MAQYAQVERNNFYMDITIKNTEAATALTKGLIVQIDAATYATAPDPMPCKLVATGDDDAVAYAVVVDDSIAAGATGRACRFGSVVAKSGAGGVTANDLLVLDSGAATEGCVKTLADAVAHVGKLVGVADHTAAAGEYVRIFFNIGMSTTA